MGRPVFQMSLAIDQQGRYGYRFPSEVGESYVSTVFVIPLEPGESVQDIIKYEYELPGMLGGKVETYTVQLSKEEVFILRHGKLPRPIRFSIYYPFDPLAQRTYPYMRSFPYMGSQMHVVSPYTHFVPIMPLDIQTMDEVCKSEGMVFVGKTDVFPSQ